MADSKIPPSENAKVLSSNKRTLRTNGVITGNDATRSGLPSNCIVIPMTILARPEPIKKKR